MKFLVDAQLPYRLARFLQKSGYDTIHTLDLPLKNATSDTEINALSLRENRILITKDKDFLESFILKGQPAQLLLITTGNISNKELERLFTNNFTQITELFANYKLIEMSKDALIIHF
jgi:predicted nuclease of predicted toxin-antitoxin system